MLTVHTVAAQMTSGDEVLLMDADVPCVAGDVSRDPVALDGAES